MILVGKLREDKKIFWGKFGPCPLWHTCEWQQGDTNTAISLNVYSVAVQQDKNLYPLFPLVTAAMVHFVHTPYIFSWEAISVRYKPWAHYFHGWQQWDTHPLFSWMAAVGYTPIIFMDGSSGIHTHYFHGWQQWDTHPLFSWMAAVGYTPIIFMGSSSGIHTHYFHGQQQRDTHPLFS